MGKTTKDRVAEFNHKRDVLVSQSVMLSKQYKLIADMLGGGAMPSASMIAAINLKIRRLHMEFHSINKDS